MRYTRAQQHCGLWDGMAHFLSPCPGMGGYQRTRHFLGCSPSRIKMGKTAWSIASQSFALGWERCQWEEKLPSLIQRKFRQLPACQAPWHIPAQAVPVPPVCALGLQLRGKENHPPTQEMGGSRGAAGEQGVCASSILVSLFKHWLSIAPGELRGSVCLSGTQQP